MKNKFIKLRGMIYSGILISLWSAFCFIFCFLIMLPLTIVFMPINALGHPIRLLKTIYDFLKALRISLTSVE